MLISWTGPGDPFYRGVVGEDRIRRIQSLTMKDHNDRMFWRPSIYEGWRALDMPTRKKEYDALNNVLSEPEVKEVGDAMG